MVFKKNITEYNFDKEVVDLVIQFNQIIKDNDLKKIKKLLGAFTLEILNKIKNNKITSKVADKAYLLLDLFFTDNMPELRDDSTISQLLFEGNILHDLGQSYGADLKLMEALANKLLSN